MTKSPTTFSYGVGSRIQRTSVPIIKKPAGFKALVPQSSTSVDGKKAFPVSRAIDRLFESDNEEVIAKQEKSFFEEESSEEEEMRVESEDEKKADMAKIMHSIVAYIDVNIEDGSSASKGLALMVTSMGGKVKRTLTAECTHLIFRAGMKSTFTRAQKLADIRIVTPDWIAECRRKSRLLSETKFAIDESELRSSKRRRSMEPKSFQPVDINQDRFSSTQQLAKALGQSSRSQRSNPESPLMPKRVQTERFNSAKGVSSPLKQNLKIELDSDDEALFAALKKRAPLDKENSRAGTIIKSDKSHPGHRVKSSHEIHDENNENTNQENNGSELRTKTTTTTVIKKKKRTATGLAKDPSRNLDLPNDTYTSDKDEFKDSDAADHKRKTKNIYGKRSKTPLTKASPGKKIKKVEESTSDADMFDDNDGDDVEEEVEASEASEASEESEVDIPVKRQTIASKLTANTSKKVEKPEKTKKVSESATVDKKARKSKVVKNTEESESVEEETVSPESKKTVKHVKSLTEKKKDDKSEKRKSNAINSVSPKGPISSKDDNDDDIDFCEGDIEKNVKENRRLATRSNIVLTSISSTEQAKMKIVINEMGRLRLVDRVDLSTTHIVAGRPRRTMTVLLGISRGSWILKPQWIPDSVAAGYWLPEHEYEAKDWFPACELSRMEKDLVKAKRGGAEDGTMGRGLLKGQKVFIGLIKAPVHEIDVLIKSCAGEVVQKPSDATIIIGLLSGSSEVDFGKNRRKKRKCVNEHWLFDCVMESCIKDESKYQVEEEGEGVEEEEDEEEEEEEKEDGEEKQGVEDDKEEEEEEESSPRVVAEKNNVKADKKRKAPSSTTKRKAART